MKEETTPQPGTPPDPLEMNPAFQRLCEVIAKLRSPEGCPWDRQQTLASIKPYTLEETYELLEAIDSDDNTEICEELGDLLLQVVLDAQIAADEGRFELIDVVRGITEKMVHRHPHVFGDAVAETADDVSEHWNKAKQVEKQRESIFDGIPTALPQLARASRITKRAAQVGYDFPNRDMLFDKLREETDELAVELFDDGQVPDVAASVESDVIPDHKIEDAARLSRIESEIGDMLFVIANIARRWGVSPEEALRQSNQKFIRRFQHVEQELARQGQTVADSTLVEMERAYQQGKQRETH